MSGTDVIAPAFVTSGQPMARIGRIDVAGPLSLRVTWAEGARAGTTDLVDLAPVVGSYRIYRPLRDNPELFASARIVEDGYVLAWDGKDLEMTAEVVEQCARETMSPADFADFLKRNSLTQEAAAALLGRSRRQIGYYLKPGPVPRIVALACFGYEALEARGREATRPTSPVP